MITVRIATDFSRHPAGRFASDGPYSGEAFRRKFLEPNLEKSEEIVIEMDGARGYGSSFLEEAFGGLVRKGFSKDLIKSRISFKASNLSLKQEILEYIEQA
jgi:STAS-like domain of unknown function (DUF4325)